MGSSQSVVLAAQVTSTQRASQPSAEDHVLSSQTLPSSGSADPILVVYIYADKRDSVAHAAALEFAELHMPRLCDMAASRGVSLFPMPIYTQEQLVDTIDAFGIFSERCSRTLVAFVSNNNYDGVALPAQLPLAFVQRCIAVLNKQQPEAAAFLSDIFGVSPPSSSIRSCFSNGQFFYTHIRQEFHSSPQSCPMSTLTSTCQRRAGLTSDCGFACGTLCLKHQF
jgi:hypothetical protein